MARKSTSKVGAALAMQMAERGLTQGATARTVGAAPSYLSQIVSGHRKASAAWLDLVADTLRLSQWEREQLHRAGAADYGFRLDLTKPD